MHAGSLRKIGIINALVASLGLIGLLINVLGYYGLPRSFIETYASFMSRDFASTSIVSALLLLALGFAGIQLMRHAGHAILISQALFVIEILYFVILLVRWKLPWTLMTCPVSPFIVATGLVNVGLALQLVTGYPVWALVVVTKAGRRVEGIR